MFTEYIHALTVGLLNLNIGITEPTAALIAEIAIYAIIVYTLSSIVILIGKLTHQIRVVNTIGIKAFSTGCTIFLGVSLFWCWTQRALMFELLGYFRPSTLIAMLQNLQKGLAVLLSLVVLIIVLAIFGLVLFFCFAQFSSLFQANFGANGIIKGFFLSIYELFSGFIWLAIILCAFSFGIAIILFPFILMLGGLKASSDDDYYYYR